MQRIVETPRRIRNLEGNGVGWGPGCANATLNITALDVGCCIRPMDYYWRDCVEARRKELI